MATIITVHGTNATGPEEGPNWWQRTSEFERDVREFVQADDGKIDFKPFIWDGANSEMSRRKAGTKLLGEMKALEAQGNKYCLVGHSHGGSVIGHCLVESASRRDLLSYLSRWITVATPFIQTKRNKLLFNRIGLFGKPSYFATLIWAITILGVVYVSMDESKPALDADLLTLLLLLGFIPFICFYAITLLITSGQSKQYAPSVLHRAIDSFGSSWISFRHRNDEAVEGLRSISRLHVAIFSRRFAVSWMLLFTAVVAVSIVFAGGFVEFSLSLWFIALLEKLTSWFRELLPQSLLIPGIGPGIFGFLFFILGFGFMFLLMLLLRPISILASLLLSRGLDRLTWSQIRQSAFGNDTSGETAIGSLEVPSWLDRKFSSLPDDISCVLADKANEAAAQSSDKFRDAISKLAFSLASEKDPKKVVADYITWNELIHNVYFKLPIFRKLVCYAIAHSPGFAPSEKLKNAPEYEKLGRWLEQVQTPQHAAIKEGKKLDDFLIDR